MIFMSSSILSELLGVRIKNTAYQRLHVLTKLLVPFFISICLVFARSIYSAILLFCISLTVLLLAGIPLRTIKKYFIILASVITFIAISSTLLTSFPGEHIFFKFVILRIKAEKGVVDWCIKISDKGIFYSIFFSLRIITMIITAIVLLGSISDRELIWGLRSIRAPYGICMFLALFFRGISFFINDFYTIKDALQVRGIDIDRASLVKKFRIYTYALVPLLMLMVRRSYEVSLALESRGLKINARFPGVYYKIKPKGIDFIVILLFSIFTILFACYSG